MKNNLTALSIFCLAVSIVIGSWMLSRQSSPQPVLLTHSELASYLGVSLLEAEQLGPADEGPGSLTSVLPYLRIGNNVYFPKAAVDKWLENNKGYTRGQ